ncbi:huntingtin-interacting protein K, partial [Heterocephalus glaber]|uniref:Huntingtin-interacting protein K n=4 Tax=Hystricomorpha TaxID=33550 RepID=A0AAX6RKX3_HETGA
AVSLPLAKHLAQNRQGSGGALASPAPAGAARQPQPLHVPRSRGGPHVRERLDPFAKLPHSTHRAARLLRCQPSPALAVVAPSGLGPPAGELTRRPLLPTLPGQLPLRVVSRRGFAQRPELGPNGFRVSTWSGWTNSLVCLGEAPLGELGRPGWSGAGTARGGEALRKTLHCSSAVILAEASRTRPRPCPGGSEAPEVADSAAGRGEIDMATEGDVELELETETSCPERPPEKPRKHDSGAADLERVTDYAEEKEIQSSNLETAMSVIGDRRSREQKARQEREKELAKVTIKKEDLELIMTEMEISRAAAERSLREHMGNVVEALIALTN